jgi:hypothetical protein
VYSCFCYATEKLISYFIATQLLASGANQLDSDGKGIQRVNVIPQWGWPSVDRSWLINPAEGIGTKGIFGALFPAFMLYLLFFIDHNISSIRKSLIVLLVLSLRSNTYILHSSDTISKIQLAETGGVPLGFLLPGTDNCSLWNAGLASR